jgi:glycosyltransferase involved in cell wall biosynthesis
MGFWSCTQIPKGSPKRQSGRTAPGLSCAWLDERLPISTLEARERAGRDPMRLMSKPDDGIYSALNKGVRNITGGVVGFIHRDDFLADDGVLARIAAAFADPAVEAVFSDLVYVSKGS